MPTIKLMLRKISIPFSFASTGELTHSSQVPSTDGWRAWRLRRSSFSGTGTFQNIGDDPCAHLAGCVFSSYFMQPPLPGATYTGAFSPGIDETERSGHVWLRLVRRDAAGCGCVAEEDDDKLDTGN